MKKFQSIPCFLVLTLTLIFLTSCGEKELKEEYPAEISIVEGVKKVSNPVFPKQGTVHYLMEEELSIGVMEGDEEYMLNQPQEIKIDQNGNIYVLDWGDACINVYDENGIYLRTIGQKGQGPGEFDTPAYYDLSSDGRIFLMDQRNRRVVIFDGKGEYLGGFRLEGVHLGMKTDAQNRIYFEKEIRRESPADLPVTKDFQEIEVVNQIIRCRPDSSDRFVFGEFEGEKDRIKKMKTGGVMTTGSKYNIVWDVTANGMMYEGLNDLYEINVFDTNGTKVRTFSREYEPVVQEIIRDGEVVTKITRPAYDPRKGFEFDGEGNIWVAFYSEDLDENVYDVFSPDGIYIRQVIVPHRIFEFFEGKVYSIVTTEEEFRQVKRFKLVNPEGTG